MQLRFVASADLTEGERHEILATCNAAYQEELTQYLVDVGPGWHAVVEADGSMVSHAMLVDRWIEVSPVGLLRTAYVELVATHPAHQGRGHASRLLRALVPRMPPCVIGALTPTVPAFYERLGWERWRGPLAVRTSTGLQPAPADELLMILRLPETPAVLPLDAPLSIEWRPGEVW